ncbi:hypothetical protein Y032_0030g2076 [Ancylostoma ceylanicum]|uniref:Uncharacterized protein n=1 Tax=Ancylostoma ceylanicum TaxID=53326 RepID=A0A016UPZ7_9BILA|nr:hypothetical protein Y032_0030g2076 [Ancylostoma ceylanicum]
MRVFAWNMFLFLNQSYNTPVQNPWRISIAEPSIFSTQRVSAFLKDVAAARPEIAAHPNFGFVATLKLFSFIQAFTPRIFDYSNIRILE